MTSRPFQAILSAVLVSGLSCPTVLADSIGLKLEIATRLGVKTTVDVGRADCGDSLLHRLGAGWYGSMGEPMLAVEKDDGTSILIPWRQITDVSARERTQVVSLRDGSEHSGKLRQIVASSDDPDKKYDLATATSVRIIETPPEKEEADTFPARERKPEPEKKQWNLWVAAGTSPMQVTLPRFVFSYYSTSGYILGGSDRTAIARSFSVTVNGEGMQANIDDFELLELGVTGDKPSLSVKAKDGEPVSGLFSLSADDDKGNHNAHTWLLAVDQPDGCILALKNPKWKLVAVPPTPIPSVSEPVEPPAGVRPRAPERHAVAAAEIFCPAQWGLGLGTLPKHSTLPVGARLAASEKDFANLIAPAEWQAAFKRHFDIDLKNPVLPVMMFVLQIDPLWEAGTCDTVGVRRYLDRISLLPADAARQWHRELDEFGRSFGSSVDLTEAVAYLIQSDPLFPDGMFSAERSGLLLARLKTLDRGSVEAWSDAVGLYPQQAALSLIHHESCFDASGAFQAHACNEVIKEIGASTTEGAPVPPDDAGDAVPPRDEPRVERRKKRPARPATAPRASQASRAKLQSADKHRTAGRHAEAYEAYKSLATREKSSPAGREAARRVATYEADPAFMKKYKAAAPKNPAADSLLSLAKSYSVNGKADLARRTYERVLKDHPDTMAAQSAKEALAAMNE